MKFKIMISVASWLVMIPSMSSASVYKYVDYAVPEDFQEGVAYFSIDTSSGRYDTGDSGDAVTFCSRDERFYCLRTPSLSFGVPRKRLRADLTWEFDQDHFRVLKKMNLEILGVSREVWVITSSSQSRSNVFYYSEEHGLLGIKYLGAQGRSVHFFLISGRDGFPR